MRPHWKKYLRDLQSRLAHLPQLLVASDFDGTLAPLVDQPERAALSPESRQVLVNLAARHPRVRMAFLSGRSLADLAQRLGIGLEQAILAGNHGLELRGAGLNWIHPASIAARPHLESLVAQLHQGLDHIAGVEVEDKGVSLTLHYRRMLEASIPKLRAIVDGLVMPVDLRMHEGKMTFEFRPRVEWNKGLAIRRILQRLNLPDEATVFLGDDATDEDVFRELETTAITVYVGSPSNASYARFNADDPADAVRFLNALVCCLDRS